MVHGRSKEGGRCTYHYYYSTTGKGTQNDYIIVPAPYEPHLILLPLSTISDLYYYSTTATATTTVVPRGDGGRTGEEKTKEVPCVDLRDGLACCRSSTLAHYKAIDHPCPVLGTHTTRVEGGQHTLLVLTM